MSRTLSAASTRGLAFVAASLTIGAVTVTSPQVRQSQTLGGSVVTIRDADVRHPGFDRWSRIRVERDELVAPGLYVESAGVDAGRGPRRLLTFAHLSDMHIVDEESPLRMELADPILGRSYRPQDGLTPQVLERMVVAIRSTTSPATGHRAELVITTGDNTDTGQRNEVRGFIDLLDGGPVAPDSGVHGSCGLPIGRDRYEGVRGTDGFYEPDASGLDIDGPGYAPNVLPDAPGLFESMNAPFEATGVGMPWYSVFGNHDALVQGNVEPSETLVALATGCSKVVGLPDATLQEIGKERGRNAVIDATYSAMVEAVRTRREPGVAFVESDPDRRPLSKGAFIAEHFRTRGQPVGHGFSRDAIATGDGWYDFAPVDGVRFIVLDTVSETGGHQGNVDATQFRWLHRELLTAEARHELVLVFAHHTLLTLVEDGPDGGVSRDGPVHLGVGSDPSAIEPCADLRREDPPTDDETLRCLFLRHPGVIAFVNGHEHRNHITAWRPDRPGARQGEFWEITTASHVEWPQQARLIDLSLDEHGDVVLDTTMIDHASPARPIVDAPRSVEDLASVARELALDDPHARLGEPGVPDPAGTATDQDATLRLPDPYRDATP